MAHPLNQPRFDAGSGRVVEGYGVLQPRVSFHPGAWGQTEFQVNLKLGLTPRSGRVFFLRTGVGDGRS